MPFTSWFEKESKDPQHPDTEQLIQFLDGELKAEEHSAVFTHLGACPDCTRDLDEIRSILGECLPGAQPSQEVLLSALDRLVDRMRQYQQMQQPEGDRLARIVQEIGSYLGSKVAAAAQAAGNPEGLVPAVHNSLSVFLGKKVASKLENRLLGAENQG